MKNRRNRLVYLVISVAVFSLLLLQLGSCTKETEIITKPVKDTVYIRDTTYYDVVCPLRGTFTGSGTSHLGNSSYGSYTFQDNNFVVGREVAGGPFVTWGGYRNTCDSVVMSVYYKTNSSYYLLKGKFSNNRNTISGTFSNLTIPADFGTFTLSK
jgi:hypothetical protein